MTRPAVADLWCNQSVDCCTPQGATLQDINDAVLATPTLGTAPEQALIAKYEAAIEIAHQRLGSHVCMAKYVGQCSLTVSVCVEETCCPCPNPCAVNCDRVSVALPELGGYLAPNRIVNITIDADTFQINEEPAVEDGWMLTSHDGWLLSGPLVTDGGKFTMTMTTSPVRVEWLEAVKSLACTFVPGTHAEGCDRENPEFAPPPGFLNNEIADSLDSRCASPDLRFGSMGTNIRTLRWV